MKCRAISESLSYTSQSCTSEDSSTSSKVACGSAPAAEQARTSEEDRNVLRGGSAMVPLSTGHAYASLADARSSFGDNGGGGDGAPQRLISAWSSLRSTISSRPQ